MVLAYRSSHKYDFDFSTASLAHFNKYPNPWSAHVASADTVAQWVDGSSRLHTERLIKKKGRLPKFIKPFLGKISDTWVLETTIVDPKNKVMEAWTRNLDHTRVLRVDEFTTFRTDHEQTNQTVVSNNVSFESNFGWGIRDRIENWSYKKFIKNNLLSRKAMSFVMTELREKGIKGYWQMQLSRARQLAESQS